LLNQFEHQSTGVQVVPQFAGALKNFLNIDAEIKAELLTGNLELISKIKSYLALL